MTRTMIPVIEIASIKITILAIKCPDQHLWDKLKRRLERI